MRMIKYILTISLILSILVLGSRFIVSAAVGVQPGQWAKYSASVAGQEISSLTVTITSVSGDTVYYSLKTEYPGGITQTTSYQGDVSDGDTFPYIISANLDVGDYIYYRTLYDYLQVESVTTRSYAGASRTVVSATSYGTTYYWDQQSGIMAEQTWGSGMMTSSYKMTQTNIWSGSVFDMSSPLFWIILIIIIVVIVVVTVVVVLLIMRKKKRPAMEKAAVPPAPTPPTTPSPTLVEKSASTRYCLKCGAGMPLEAKFCPKCGYTQHER